MARSRPESSPRRFAGRPLAQIWGREIPIARGYRARLLGLAWLDLEEAGPGLVIPRCSSVHTFGMRFDLDIWFLDARAAPIEVRRAVPPRRFVACSGARAVLELPAVPNSGFRGDQGGASPTPPRT
jgi:uncharacterized protein